MKYEREKNMRLASIIAIGAPPLIRINIYYIKHREEK